MYAGVPMLCPTPVSVTGAVVACAMRNAFAIPKSVTTAVPPEIRMLSGLISRWTMPRACANTSARPTSRKMQGTHSSATLCRAGMRARSVRQRTACYTMAIQRFRPPCAQARCSPAAMMRRPVSPRETLYTDLGGQLGREQFDDDVALECGLVRTKVAAHATAAEYVQRPRS